MTRKEREAAEALEIEASIERLNDECDAEVRERSCHDPSVKVIDIQQDVMEERVRRALIKDSLFASRYGYSISGTPITGRVSFGFDARWERFTWMLKHPFGSDLIACVETNS